MAKDLVRYREVRVADVQNDQASASAILSASSLSVTQEDFQSYVLSQIKRIIHGDNSGIWKDDFLSQNILPLQDLSVGQLFQANCLSTDAVGTLVYITGPEISGLIQVTQVNPISLSKMPAFGVIVSKSSSTICLVQRFGVTTVFTGLTAGKVYYVGSNGSPSLTPPAWPALQQIAGIAIDVATFVLSLSLHMSIDEFDNDRRGIRLLGTQNGSNRTFMTPEHFDPASIEVFHNGRRLDDSSASNEYTISESGGPGSGYDTVYINWFAPVARSVLIANYTAV